MALKLVTMRTTDEGKRIVMIERGGKDTHGFDMDQDWLVGELPFFGDDCKMRLEFDLMGTILYHDEAKARSAFELYE